ncbi:MAG: hypothetical protein ACR2GD_02155, partial [Pyrinomonadaceae bacterium]
FKTMRFYQVILILILSLTIFSCASTERPDTPFETLKAYTQAVKKTDTAAMKDLLSHDSIKMAEDEARAQNVPLDEIIERENLFGGDQTAVEFRNQKIEGETATIEIKDASGIWNMVRFVKEDGKWKIDKKGFADDLQRQIDEDNKRADELINQERKQ